MAIMDPGTRLRRMSVMGPVIQAACAQSGENKERVLALCYRESLCTFALTPPGDFIGWGDKGNAFGPFQIDKRYHSDFIKRELGRYHWSVGQGLPYSPIQQALYACGLLRSAREWLKRSTLAVTGDSLERAVYAAYNAGEARVASALRNRLDPDSVTTGKNYSGYIFLLASSLQRSESAYAWIWGDPSTSFA